jgi:hypothetical protein
MLAQRYGWAVRHVLGNPKTGAAPFSYTVGLTWRGWHELVITGLPKDTAEVFIANAVDVQSEGTRFEAGERTTELTDSGDVTFVAVQDVSGMTAAAEIVGDFSALQLVWPDSEGNYPWGPGYRNTPDAQPLLGTIFPIG